MRRLLFLTSLIVAALARAEDAAPRSATLEEVTLFKDAVHNSAQDTEHWFPCTSVNLSG